MSLVLASFPGLPHFCSSFLHNTWLGRSFASSVYYYCQPEQNIKGRQTSLIGHNSAGFSGRFRNLEGGVEPLPRARSGAENFGIATPTFGHVNVRTEYLEATLGLVKHLEISKVLIRECVTVPSCCCCIPLLYNHLMDSCSYLRKNTLLAAKEGVHLHPPYPPKS